MLNTKMNIKSQLIFRMSKPKIRPRSQRLNSNLDSKTQM